MAFILDDKGGEVVVQDARAYVHDKLMLPDLSLEKPLVLMIARMIRSKESVPHDIIRAEMGATPIITEALF